MWIEEHHFLTYKWNVARRWEISPAGLHRHSRYMPSWLLSQLDGGAVSLDYVELYLFGSVMPHPLPPVPP